MHELPHAYFHLDHPGDESSLPTGPLTIRGWAVGKPELLLVDLRVREGHTTHPTSFGFLRPDLAAHFKFHRPDLPGGFEAILSLSAGRHTFEFETCSIDGIWRPVGSLQITGVPGNASAPPAAPSVVEPHEFARALQLTLRANSAADLAVTASTIAREMPVPHVTRFPHLPFHGHLYQPARHERAFFGRMEINGWLFHETATIRRVVATVDLQAWQSLDYGRPLPDIAARFAAHPPAAACGLHGWIDIPAQLPAPLSLRIYAELTDGSWHLCHVQRTAVTDHEIEKTPFAPFSRVTFGRACLALHRACRQAGSTVSVDRAFVRGVRGVYQEYRSRAPLRAATEAAPPAPAPRHDLPLPRAVALFTHNLGFQGAPLFLVEYAQALAADNVRLTVFSAEDGPLRANFERLGATVRLVDLSPLSVATDASALRAGLRALATSIQLADADLVVANTLSTYWAVHLAHSHRIPSLFLIHESTTPTQFYLGHLPPALLPVIEATFSLATRVSFLTAATRRYYLPLLRHTNHVITPGWIDLAQIDRFLATQARADLRRQLAVDDHTRLVVNVGSVCTRKGQHIFARAVDLLWRAEPALARSALFLMIGGRDTQFDQMLAELLTELARPNLRVVPETDTPLAYYGAADLFVCSSYEESFPRVILEAMACGVPIVSTDVHGIPEQVRSDREAILVPPGDTYALARALARALREPDHAAARARQARDRVVAEYDSSAVIPRYLALAADAMAAG